MRRALLAIGALAIVAGCSSSPAFAPTPASKVPTPGPTSRPHEFVLYDFQNPNGEFGLPKSPAEDGAAPKGTLTFVSEQSGPTLYGRTANGGNATKCGTFFKLLTDGKKYRVTYRFSGTDGCDPRHDAMVPDPVFGFLWSTTEGVTDKPYARPRKDYNDGNIVAYNIINDTLAIIHEFKGAPTDGALQRASVTFSPIQGSGGRNTMIYGQSAEGGTNDLGEIYSMRYGKNTPTQLFSFTEQSGYEPHGGVLLLGNELWGITKRGGGPKGAGTGSVYVYPLASTSPTIVHVFNGDGKNPDGNQSNHGNLTPVTASNGNTILYGMTKCGGTGQGVDSVTECDGAGDGVIFQIDVRNRRYHTFYQFHGFEAGDGANPFGSLLYDPTSGYLYGMARDGGKNDDGTVFRIAPGAFGATGRMQILYNFTDKNGDGRYPLDNVILVGDILYGMTSRGGTSADAGTIFGLRL